MAERNRRKVQIGKVVSDKMDKTITVAVETYKMHPLYKKRVKYTKKFKAHDEEQPGQSRGYRKNYGNPSPFQR